MGQIEILEFLRKDPDRFFSSEEIRKELKVENVSALGRPLRQLRLYKQLTVVSDGKKYLYKYGIHTDTKKD